LKPPARRFDGPGNAAAFRPPFLLQHWRSKKKRTLGDCFRCFNAFDWRASCWRWTGSIFFLEQFNFEKVQLLGKDFSVNPCREMLVGELGSP
jgi:hypothetical protein